MPLLVNAQMTVVAVAANGNGNLTLGASPPGAQSFAAAGALNNTLFSYRIEEGARWEIGVGTYFGSGPTFVRSLVLASSNWPSVEVFTSAAIISNVLLPTDIPKGGRQRIINGNFSVNQRCIASGSTAYAAGVYLLDRWKAGANGTTLSWVAASNGDVTVTISSGSICQTIEGGIYTPEGGVYALSFKGTSAARVYQGSPSGDFVTVPATGLQIAGISPGANTTIEIGAGTVGLVQFEPGAVASEFERRDDELRRCQRYFEKSYPQSKAPGSASRPGSEGLFIYGINGLGGVYTKFKVTKAFAPQVTVFSPNDGQVGKLYDYVGLANRDVSVDLMDDTGFRGFSAFTGNSSGIVLAEYQWIASAEL